MKNLTGVKKKSKRNEIEDQQQTNDIDLIFSKE